MEWISDLLKALCPFCGTNLGNTRRACEKCSRELVHLENTGGSSIALCDARGELQAWAAFRYEGWAKEFILRQKRASDSHSVRWLAETLTASMPLGWRKLPVVWLPGKPLGEMHLVERMALELAQLGQPLAPRQYLRRRLWPVKPQKALDADTRRRRDIREIYRPAQPRRVETLEVLVLDDVITTGATVLGGRRILEEEMGLRVVGAISLALTPKRLASASEPGTVMD